MREDAAEQYLAYKLIDSNQDWKQNGSTSPTTTWTYRSQEGSSRSTGPGGIRS
jgi:hypothetical protein